jgi:outer membrane protein insertion porin family
MWYRSVAAVIFVLVLGFTVIPGAAAAQDYTFSAIQIEGNQRIETSTIVQGSGIARGKKVTAGELNDAYQRLLDSGVFETVDLEPRGGTLVIRVQERPTINIVNFEGNDRIKDEVFEKLIESQSRRVFNPSAAERDAAIIAQAYAQSGRVAATVTPRIIRRSDNRVDLVFEISEGDTIEIERVSFVGNRAFSDRRLRQVLQTKQANFLRAFLSGDTLIEDRIAFDKQVLRDFYLSRGYIDFRVNSANVEFTREHDAFYLVVNVTEGQQYKFGKITTVSEMDGVDASIYNDTIKVRTGVVYSPSLVEETIARMERMGIKQGVDFLRIDPRVTTNSRDQTLDVAFTLVKGPRVFVERIDIEGNTTTLDRVIRQQFRTVEGDPFNPREIRQSAERIRALGFFENANVEAREGTSSDQVIIDVDVTEQPTGSLSLGGSYSVTDGFGVAIGLSESNFLGRGQRLSLTLSTAQEAESYILGFTEPYLLGRNLRFDIDLGVAGRTSSFASYDTKRAFFMPSLTFPTGEKSALTVRYAWDRSEMLVRSPATNGPVIGSEIAQGSLDDSSLGFTYSYDSRVSGLNPNAGFLVEVGADYAGLGGDSEYLRTKAKVVAQTKVYHEEVVLRATLEGGSLHWLSSAASRSVNRFVLNPDIMRGFDPGGIGPRDVTGAANDFLGGNFYAVARFEAEFPLGLPEELGLRGGVFYDVGNLWDLTDVDTTGATIVGASGSFRHVIGFSLLWTTSFGPLRFNFSHALKKEVFDQERNFDLTIQAKF